jgi:hypothetical protein
MIVQAIIDGSGIDASSKSKRAMLAASPFADRN